MRRLRAGMEGPLCYSGRLAPPKSPNRSPGFRLSVAACMLLGTVVRCRCLSFVVAVLLGIATIHLSDKIRPISWARRSADRTATGN
jgi:hypothetical protein